MYDYMDADDGFMSQPIDYGRKKRNGDYVLPKMVVERIGLNHIEDMIEDAHYRAAQVEEKKGDSPAIKKSQKIAFIK